MGTNDKNRLLELIGETARGTGVSFERAMEIVKGRYPEIYAAGIASYAPRPAPPPVLAARNQLEAAARFKIEDGSARSYRDAFRQLREIQPGLFAKATEGLDVEPIEPDEPQWMEALRSVWKAQAARDPKTGAAINAGAEERLYVRTKQLQVERTFTFGEALDHVKRHEPQLYLEGMAERDAAFRAREDARTSGFVTGDRDAETRLERLTLERVSSGKAANFSIALQAIKAEDPVLYEAGTRRYRPVKTQEPPAIDTGAKQRLEAEAQKRVRPGVDFSAALAEVRTSNPTLYAEGVAEYRPR